MSRALQCHCQKRMRRTEVKLGELGGNLKLWSTMDPDFIDPLPVGMSCWRTRIERCAAPQMSVVQSITEGPWPCQRFCRSQGYTLNDIQNAITASEDCIIYDAFRVVWASSTAILFHCVEQRLFNDVWPDTSLISRTT